MLKRLVLDEKEMFEDPNLQNEENDKKAALKAEREDKKKENLKNKNLADLPEDELKQALKAEREIRKKQEKRKS